MNIYIESYGCSANLSNSEIIAGLLEKQGNIIVKDIKLAEVAVLNTCIVKGPTFNRMIERLKLLSKKKYIIVSGCMSNVYTKKIIETVKESNKKCLLGLVSVNSIKDTINVLNNLKQGKETLIISDKKSENICLDKISTEKIISIVQISEGCLGKCSYCATKLAKGNLFSFEKEKIIKQIENDLSQGAKEIWLTSQDCGAYGKEKGKYELVSLLKEISKIKGKFKVRLGMSNPQHVKYFIDNLIEIFKNEKFFKFLHLPIQSGSDKILKEMNRPYKVLEVEKIIEKFRSVFPDSVISTDIIAGYPYETEKDFNETFDLIKKIQPEVLNISKYWPMQKTKGALLKQIDDEVKKERATKLMNLHLKIIQEKNKLFFDKELKILVDRDGFSNTMQARDENYRIVIINGGKDLLGKFLKVKIKKAMPHYLFGEITK
ncbi:hypothetical protein COX99_02140 [Candidatus Pacearchaeota archaeon CG_4_10_14_0_2_um_filter_31_10]|nr:MAG: hypothetical protein COU55_01140 [Candidatus Pacearchaeota archaeon CG10_big_fil_rev_8_21_14_0_10_31_59]PIZ80586.1 MAG: hypothetical protein COX99_02140 [Candidatus Pacearchaeota archaeon CG_4_10_14_0_2_um_filter_31_10]